MHDSGQQQSSAAIRRNRVRERIGETRRRRSSDAALITHLSSRGALHNRFAAQLTAHIRAGDASRVFPHVRTLVSDLREAHGVTAEHIRRRTSAKQMWQDHLDPMYYALRGYIMASRRPDAARPVSAFWLLVANELQAQLAMVAHRAHVPEDALGAPVLIAESELKP